MEGVFPTSDSASRVYNTAENESEQMSRQMDLMRKEKVMAERELQIARRKNRVTASNATSKHIPAAE